MNKWLSLIFVLSISVSCDDNRAYEEFAQIGESWPKSDTIFFRSGSDHINEVVKPTVHFRVDRSYAYHNFYFKSLIYNPQGILIKDELEQAFFFEPKTGRPLGKGLGDVYDLEYPLPDELASIESGEYIFGLVQFMRRDTLKGVKRVGLRLDRISSSP